MEINKTSVTLAIVFALLAILTFVIPRPYNTVSGLSPEENMRLSEMVINTVRCATITLTAGMVLAAYVYRNEQKPKKD